MMKVAAVAVALCIAAAGAERSSLRAQNAVQARAAAASRLSQLASSTTRPVAQTVFAELQRRMAAKAPVDDILELISSIRSTLKADHTSTTTQYNTDKSHCESTLSSISQTIEEQTSIRESEDAKIEEYIADLAAKRAEIEAMEARIENTKGNIANQTALNSTLSAERQQQHAHYIETLEAHKKALDAVHEIKTQLKTSNLYSEEEEAPSTGEAAPLGDDSTTVGGEAPPMMLVQIASRMSRHLQNDEDVVALMNLLATLNSTLSTRVAEVEAKEVKDANSWANMSTNLDKMITQLQTQLAEEEDALATLKVEESTLTADKSTASTSKSEAKSMIAENEILLANESSRCEGVNSDYQESKTEYNESIRVLDALVQIVEEKLSDPMSHDTVQSSTKDISK